MAAVIEQLIVYPVKSCRGVSVKQGAVADTGASRWNCVVLPSAQMCHLLEPTLPSRAPSYAGFAYDRQFMVVLEKSGRFVTQRQLPKCVLS